jgi:2-keto-3-deoxy-6-phosphogluconate aldolase
MALRRFGFIVKGAGYEPATHTVKLASPQITTTMVGVSRPEDAPAVAQAMVADGVQLIELCGGFGPRWTARVIEAIAGKVPVGAVAYGPESIDQMHALFAD